MNEREQREQLLIVAEVERLTQRAEAAEGRERVLREALESVRAAFWDRHYGGGITKDYAQAVDAEIRAALAASPEPQPASAEAVSWVGVEGRVKTIAAALSDVARETARECAEIAKAEAERARFNRPGQLQQGDEDESDVWISTAETIEADIRRKFGLEGK